VLAVSGKPLASALDSPAAPDGEVLRHVLHGLASGVAVVDPESWAILFENATFFKWFPPDQDADEPLPKRLPGLNASRALARLQEGRAFSFDTESGSGGRAVPISAELRPLPGAGHNRFVVECRDVSKQKQAEYMLESYSQMAERNSRDLQREKDRAEKLLLNIMPKTVYEEMRDYGTVTPQRFENATVLMLDFVGFTDMAIAREPGSLITELNDIFTAFDRIVELFGCERIKTIGDAYMAVSGVPEVAPDHAQNIARAALRMKRYIERRNLAHPEAWQCRIGINSGPLIGSIVGVQKYVYDIFGPGVNLASRMESLSEAMRITLTEETYSLIKDDFICTERGEFEVKGFGTKTLYFLERERERFR
jgi:adenylate cyclase